MIRRLTLNTLFIAVLLMFIPVSASAQDLKVRSLAVAQGDLSASVNVRNDRNGVACGLIKVQLVGAGAKFEGNIIGDVSFQNNEYWVYMNQGAYLLNVKHPDFLPLDINLHDHGLKDGVQPKVTYKLVLTTNRNNSNAEDDGLRFVKLKVEPQQDVMVYIDDNPQIISGGVANILLPMGHHTYRAEGLGYGTKSGSFDLGNETLPLNIRLESTLATLSVSTPTTGAIIYVNDELKGQTPWSGQLPAGIYRVEARHEGYRPQRQRVTLSQLGTETVTLPALQAIAGRLSVNYLPQDAEVWLDGKHLGTSPDVFRDIPVGRHEVEIRRQGYETKKETVTIAEGQTASLSGTLTVVQSGSGNATTSVISASGSIETFIVGGVSFNMVRVEGGTFLMGSDDSEVGAWEKPVHQVTLDSYFIGETEVTQGLWEVVMGKNPSSSKGSNLPVEYVSWKDCQKFIKRLNSKTGRSFRLPTEAEWEFAARGGNRSMGYKYSGSNTIDDVAWSYGNSNGDTHPVSTKLANELGLYDMSGNVEEWCQDWDGSYSSASQTNPTGPSSGSRRVCRGGSYGFGALRCRSYKRFSGAPSSSGADLGLRLAL